MTARRMNDRRKLSPEERKQAYEQRFKPKGKALAVLDRPLVGLEFLRAEERKHHELIAIAQSKAPAVLGRLYELAMMDPRGDANMAAVCVRAAGSYLGRAGMAEVKGQITAFYAKIKEDLEQIEEARREAEQEKELRTVEVGILSEGLGPEGPML